MSALVTSLEYLNLGLLTLVALAALWHWRSGRGHAALWAALTFATLALVVHAGQLVPDAPDTTLEGLGRRVLVLGLILFPYFLLRFAIAFEPAPARLEWIAGGLTAALFVWTLALPSIPASGEGWPGWFAAYVAAFVVHWSGLSLVAAGRLLWAGRRQPTVVRRRMQLLATAAASIAATLVVSVLTPTDEPVSSLVVTLLLTASALGFLAGLAPPAALRLVWRRPETAAAQGAISRLMAATTETDIAREVLPPMARIVGAHAVALRDLYGRVIGAHGASDEMLAAADEGVAGGADELMEISIPGGSLLLWVNPYAPYFGREELAALRSLGALTGLALDRARLFAHEREAREALERADELKSNFVALAAHELRTPVTAIDGIVQTLHARGRQLTQERRAELETTLAGQTAHMRSLVDQLLDLSRLDAEAVAIAPAIVRVRERLESVIATAAGERRAEVVLEVDERLEAVVDPAALDRIVSNLVTNALRYGSPPVRVRAERRDRHFRLAVEDRGAGVPAEFVPNLFERFTRSGVGRERISGTGLGLAIARSYAAAHGGDLVYEPAEPTGARFRLVIPLETGPKNGTPVAPSELTER